MLQQPNNLRILCLPNVSYKLPKVSKSWFHDILNPKAPFLLRQAYGN